VNVVVTAFGVPDRRVTLVTFASASYVYAVVRPSGSVVLVTRLVPGWRTVEMVACSDVPWADVSDASKGAGRKPFGDTAGALNTTRRTWLRGLGTSVCVVLLLGWVVYA